MSITQRPALGRVAALALLALLALLFVVGPLAAYCGLIADNNDALAAKAALLHRYRTLSHAEARAAPPPGPALLYPDMPESQATALLQETVKTAAAAARVQVQGLQVLRGETANGAMRIGVRVRASGDIASLRGLLYAIETAHPALYPDNLSIQSLAPAAGVAPSPLNFQFDVSGFKAVAQS
jgi:hypothetical protein